MRRKRWIILFRKSIILILLGVFLYGEFSPIYAAAPKVKKITWKNVNSTVYVPLKSSKKTKLKVTISPKKARRRKLTWSSRNKRIATVGKTGKIYPKKIGKTTIACKVLSQPKKKVKCKVYVVKPSKKISMRTNNCILQVEKTYTRKAKIFPASATVKTIRYISSDPRVAAVDKNGVVTAKSEGTATITAKAKDGFAKSKSYTVQVIGNLKESAKFIAHRGLSAEAPENTLKAFSLAGSAGFWGAETDIRKTSDGRFILMHDDTLSRMCGVNRAPEDMTLEEIKNARIISGNGYKKYKTVASATTIPTLEEYLNTCKAYNIVPVIEIKMNYDWSQDGQLSLQTDDLPELESEMMTDAREMDPVETDDTGMTLQSAAEDDLMNLYHITNDIMKGSNVVFIGFDLQAILKLRSIINAEGGNPSVELQHLVNSVDLNNLDLYKKYNIGLDANFHGTDVNTAISIIKTGIPMNIWTLNDEAKIWEYVKNKIPYITTDRRWW